MKKVGIITIHRIYNYGSILQAYALYQVIKNLGYSAKIIDYIFPNSYHRDHIDTTAKVQSGINFKQKFLKLCYALDLMGQHRKMRQSLSELIETSHDVYESPESLTDRRINCDIYVTGSDQVWNPRYTKGDPTFFLDFVPDDKKKIAYAASFGVSELDTKYNESFGRLLSRYSCISVREKSGEKIVAALTGNKITATTVLDPTLLLSKDQWGNLIPKTRLVEEKYILCYYLNYTFNAFPFADDLAEYIHKETGYRIIRLGRPPVKFFNGGQRFYVNAGPYEMMRLVRDAELVLTTSFHGTAFAVNFGVPVFSIIENRLSKDSRQSNLLSLLGLTDRILSKDDSFPDMEKLTYDTTPSLIKLEQERKKSIEFLTQALYD